MFGACPVDDDDASALQLTDRRWEEATEHLSAEMPLVLIEGIDDVRYRRYVMAWRKEIIRPSFMSVENMRRGMHQSPTGTRKPS